MDQHLDADLNMLKFPKSLKQLKPTKNKDSMDKVFGKVEILKQIRILSDHFLISQRLSLKEFSLNIMNIISVTELGVGVRRLWVLYNT